MKKTIAITTMISIIVIIFIGYTLIYPTPSFITNNTTKYDENYFLNQFPSSDFHFLGDNKFEITEKELNGFIDYKLSNNEDVIDLPSSFHLKHLQVRLLKEEIIVEIYGKYVIFPIKIELNLIPIYDKGILHFTVEGMKLSRIKIPSKYIKLFMENESKTEGKPRFSMSLHKEDIFIVHNVSFQEGKIVIHYTIDNAKILEKLINRFRK